ncbi:MAG TPA: hypothetical protein VK114_04120, partial [Nitrososphaerales archaeon]|nr:hypothetical protein [Nitrososphaerales archaeon]
SFYRHNSVDLPMGRLSLRESKEEEVEVTAEPTATEFLQMTKRVLDAGKLSVRDRAVVLVKLQSFCDNKVLCNVFNYVAYPQLVRHFGSEDPMLWDEKKVPVKINLVRPKNHYQYFTFIDRDAVEALKEWLRVREALQGKVVTHRAENPRMLPRSDPLFTTRYGGEWRPLRPSYIATMFNRFGQRAGVNVRPRDDLPKGKEAKRRYPFHGHEVRDTAITLARTVKADREVVEFFCGHKIDPLGYDKSARNDPDLFRKEYQKLAPHLNIVTGKGEQLRQSYEQRLQEELREKSREFEDMRRTLAEVKEENRDQRKTLEKLIPLVEEVIKTRSIEVREEMKAPRAETHHATPSKRRRREGKAAPVTTR